MTALDRLIPTPRLVETESIELALPLERTWEVVRHMDLASSRPIRALFALRTLPGRIGGQRSGPLRLSIDELVSSEEKPGFQLLVDDAPRELVIGAIGKVWQPDIAFAHVTDTNSYAAFSRPDYVKVAWALRLSAWGQRYTRLTFELRVDATDDAAWHKFRAYFFVIGPGSRFIRSALLAQLVREQGSPGSIERHGRLPGDELLPDAIAQTDHAITMAATPEAIWPWLVQMGCRRAGFYSYDWLDNAGRRSARELHPELQTLSVGDIIPATPNGDDGFEVLRVDPARVLILGGLFDPARARQLSFSSSRPETYWHVTWSFVLEALDDGHTRLHVRARAACAEGAGLRIRWIKLVHHFMQRAQLKHLAARVESRFARDDVRDILEGMAGAAIATASLLTPFLQSRRRHWGVTDSEAARSHPGDELVPEPLWGWMHGIEIEAPSDMVWPWLAQIGANKGGFYSYQWLENLLGCDLRNAEVVHPEWAARRDDELKLHPRVPGYKWVSVEPGRHVIAYGAPNKGAQIRGQWLAISWLLAVEPLGPTRCRAISRFRSAYSEGLLAQLSFGPSLLEPVSFAMDRRMLIGIKQRAEAMKRTPASLSLAGFAVLAGQPTAVAQ